MRLIRAVAMHSFMEQMAYPMNFWLAIVIKSARIVLMLVFFKAIYSRISDISGWNFGETLFLFATFTLIEFIVSAFFARNFGMWHARRLKNGAFDYQIIRPVNLQFHVAFYEIDIMDLANIVPLGFLYWYALENMATALSAANILLYIFLVMNAIIFFYSFMLIISTINFWTIQSTGLWKFVQGVTWTARYPTDIYLGIWRTIFSFILPIAFIATWPAKAFMGTLSWQNAAYSLIFTAVLFVVANRFWNFGLKHYSSASS